MNIRLSLQSRAKNNFYIVDSYQVSSKLAWECLQTLQTLAADNSIALCWVPGHRGIDGNKKADALAKREAETLYFGPEPVCGISMRTA